MMKRCPRCGETKPVECFPRNRARQDRDGLGSECRDCANARSRRHYQTHAERLRLIMTIRRHGITVEDFEARLAAQGHLCAVCSEPPGLESRRLEIDHDHACCPASVSCGSCVRGLVCRRCNDRLARFDDDPDRMRAADWHEGADYIEAWLAQTVSRAA